MYQTGSYKPYGKKMLSQKPQTCVDTQAEQTSDSTLPLHILGGLTQALSTAIITYDADNSVTYRCANASKHFNIPEDVIAPGSNFNDLVDFLVMHKAFGSDSDDCKVGEYLDTIAAFRKTENVNRHHREQRTESGRRLRHNTICAEDGSLIIYIEDITKESRSREMADIALKIGNAGYWSLCFETQRYFLSETVRKLLTEDEVEDIQENGWWNRLHEDDLEPSRAAWQHAFKTGEKMDFTYRIACEKSGTRYFRNVGYPEFSTNGKPLGAMCFVMDVTDQKKIEEELERAKVTAETALSTSNTFLARMSHEIRTPMNGIMGLTDALLSAERGKAATEELQVIKRSAENLLRVMDDTLEMAKLKSENLDNIVKPESPRQAISDVGRLWKQKAAENGTSLTVRIHKSVPDLLEFDRSRFEQCLNNLLSNAVKFTQNGEISILSKLTQQDGRDMLVVAVKDTGIGMTPEQQEKVFLPFKQADDTIKSRFGGTGLGMSITKNLVELMGGTVQMRSKVAEGTVFMMLLPVSLQTQNNTSAPLSADFATQAMPQPPKRLPKLTLENQVKNTADPASDKPASPAPNNALPQVMSADEARSGLSNMTVLVAEDNDTNRMVVKALFEHVFGEMYFAENGREAIEILGSQHVDIVLMDIHMPIMDGIEATIAIRSSDAAYSNVPIIALTADPEFQQKRVCVNIGMNDAQSKPVNREDVIEACVNVLSERSRGALQAKSA